MQQMLAIHIQQPPLQHTKHLRKQLDLITYVLHIIMKTTWSSIFDRTVLKLRCNDNHWCFPSSFLDFVTIPMLPPLVSESCNYLSCENIKLRFFFFLRDTFVAMTRGNSKGFNSSTMTEKKSSEFYVCTMIEVRACRVWNLPDRTGWTPFSMIVTARNGERSEAALATTSPSVKI